MRFFPFNYVRALHACKRNFAALPPPSPSKLPHEEARARTHIQTRIFSQEKENRPLERNRETRTRQSQRTELGIHR